MHGNLEKLNTKNYCRGPSRRINRKRGGDQHRKDGGSRSGKREGRFSHDHPDEHVESSAVSTVAASIVEDSCCCGILFFGTIFELEKRINGFTRV